MDFSGLPGDQVSVFVLVLGPAAIAGLIAAAVWWLKRRGQ